jgi:hypothetical protein
MTACSIRRVVAGSIALASVGLAGSALAAAKMEVTIDDRLTPQIAKQFQSAKTLAMPVTIEADVRTAEAFEQMGRYDVTPDRELGARGNVLMNSERKALLKTLCEKSHPDIALVISYKSAGNSGVGGAMLSGKTVINFDWTLNALPCKSGTQEEFGGTLVWTQGIFSVAGRSEQSQAMANAMVSKLVAAFGR